MIGLATETAHALAEAARLQREQAARDAHRRQANRDRAAAILKEDRIDLDVSGEMLSVGRAVLLTDPGSVLAAMFAEYRPQSGTRVFIGREPRAFNYVLTWLRTNVAPTQLTG